MKKHMTMTKISSAVGILLVFLAMALDLPYVDAQVTAIALFVWTTFNVIFTEGGLMRADKDFRTIALNGVTAILAIISFLSGFEFSSDAAALITTGIVFAANLLTDGGVEVAK